MDISDCLISQLLVKLNSKPNIRQGSSPILGVGNYTKISEYRTYRTEKYRKYRFFGIPQFSVRYYTAPKRFGTVTVLDSLYRGISWYTESSVYQYIPSYRIVNICRHFGIPRYIGIPIDYYIYKHTIWSICLCYICILKI